MTTEQRIPHAGPDTTSTNELVQRAAEQIAQLVRDELRLARQELTVKARRAGTGAGLFGAAGVVAAYGVAALLATLILLLALVLPAWAAALIVTVALFAVAAVMALVGRGRVGQAGPPVPEQTVESVKTDVRTVSDAVAKRGNR
jgi:uncharacterized membrane protein YqjE